MGIGKTYVKPERERGGEREEGGGEAEKEKSLPHCFDFGRKKKKSPNNLAHVSLEKMRAAKNGYNTP